MTIYRRSGRSAKDIQPHIPDDPDNLLPISGPVEHVRPSELSLEAKTHIMDVLGSTEIPEHVYIAYYGRDAYRAGEPAMIINYGQYESSQRDEAGQMVACYCVKYLDGVLKWFPQSTQTVNFGNKPPIWKREKIWCAIIPGNMIRNRYAIRDVKKR